VASTTGPANYLNPSKKRRAAAATSAVNSGNSKKQAPMDDFMNDDLHAVFREESPEVDQI